jgi:hypothetical protein
MPVVPPVMTAIFPSSLSDMVVLLGWERSIRTVQADILTLM